MFSATRKIKDYVFTNQERQRRQFSLFLGGVNKCMVGDEGVGVVTLEPPTEVFQSGNLWHCSLPQNFLAVPAYAWPQTSAPSLAPDPLVLLAADWGLVQIFPGILKSRCKWEKPRGCCHPGGQLVTHPIRSQGQLAFHLTGNPQRLHLHYPAARGVLTGHQGGWGPPASQKCWV